MPKPSDEEIRTRWYTFAHATLMGSRRSEQTFTEIQSMAEQSTTKAMPYLIRLRDATWDAALEEAANVPWEYARGIRHYEKAIAMKAEDEVAEAIRALKEKP